MTLKQLEAFYWAATCINFAVAAKRINLSTSSLSKRISELETSLGLLLFDRSGHRAILTEAGVQLVAQAHDLLKASESLHKGLKQGEELYGCCRFGVGELTALTWLPKLITAIRQRHPGLLIEPFVGIGEELEHRLTTGELDFAIVAGRSSRSLIASQPLAEARFVWAAANSVVPAEAELEAEIFERFPLVTLPPGAGTSRIVDDWLRANAIQSLNRIDCNSWGAIAGLLAEGTGVGILPQQWAEALQKRNRLRQLAAQPPLSSLSYSYQWRRDDTRRLITTMRGLVQEVADFSSANIF